MDSSSRHSNDDTRCLGPAKLNKSLMNSKIPIVMNGFIEHWPARKWSPQLFSKLESGETEILWRIGGSGQKEELMEKDCSYVKASFKQFNEWISSKKTGKNPFDQIKGEQWVYADYKHMNEIFFNEQMLSAVDWGRFGFEGRDGTKSTLWIGTKGAYTPCHQDTYGCNIVAQLYGRKRWVLFPPENGSVLWPTRIPFEESSIFSKINFTDEVQFQNIGIRYEVVLEPGDVLLVPKHWWHFVQNLETSISVNSWIPMESDVVDNCTELLTSMLMSSLTSYTNTESSQIYNPKEQPLDYNTAIRLVNHLLNDKQLQHYMNEGFAESKQVIQDFGHPASTLPASLHINSEAKPECGQESIILKKRKLEERTTLIQESTLNDDQKLDLQCYMTDDELGENSNLVCRCGKHSILALKPVGNNSYLNDEPSSPKIRHIDKFELINSICKPNVIKEILHNLNTCT